MVKWLEIVVVVLISVGEVLPRKKTSLAERAFEKGEGIIWSRDDDEDDDKSRISLKRTATKSAPEQSTETPPTAVTTPTTSTTTTIATTSVERTTEESDEEQEDAISQLLMGADDITNLTKQVEEEYSSALDDALNRTVLWIDASYKAKDYKLNVSMLPECQAWQRYWSTNVTKDDEANTNTTIDELNELEKDLKQTELVDNKKRLKKLGLNEDLLDAFKAVGLLYKEICRDHERVLWFRDTADAKKIGITESSLICEPFKEELTPDAETLATLSNKLNELVRNFTLGILPTSSASPRDDVTTDVVTTARDELLEETTTSEGDLQRSRSNNARTNAVPPVTSSPFAEESMRAHEDRGLTEVEELQEGTAFLFAEEPDRIHKVAQVGHWPSHTGGPMPLPFHSIPLSSTGASVTDRRTDYDHDQSIMDQERRFGVVGVTRGRRAAPAEGGDKTDKTEEKDYYDDDDWLHPVDHTTEAPDDDNSEDGENADEKSAEPRWVNIEHTEEDHPILLISSKEAIDALQLKIPADALQRFEKVSLYLPGICADYVPKAIDEFNSSSFEGVEIEGPIGVNISALESAGVNLTALAEKLRNDTDVDEILSRTNASIKTLGGSFILPVLNKNQYDPFSAPIVFQGSAVVVRFGIYIESMSNFQTSTMDYDMDIYLMMAWRDARLVNPYDKPILVKEEEILEKIWRPDPFFANAKEAEFHEVTFLNFLMRIFPDGLVLYETRIKIKPSCNLILCKYPHDKQTCDLLIKSFAYPVETVRFEWFTRRVDAIDKNPDVKLPELYIDRYEPTVCKKTRKSGAFSCLRAVFRLKRDVGFHIAQTYIPTSLALMFSWVGVWLPEEFMEGRIGVAITVLLTLSTESAGAREHLPSVSYLKAIDLWFGFITGFVFFTLLQTLFVIGFDKRANQMKKWATRRKTDITEEVREMMLLKAKRYHKTGRYLDNFCRVFYPLSFVLFLIMYYFVFTEGRQDDCINRR